MREKPKYDIESITYTKKFVGLDENGKRKYEIVGEPKCKIIKEKNFSDLKQKLYSQSKDNNDAFVEYKKPTYRITEQPKQVKSFTVHKSPTEKTVTYYRAVKKSNSK